MLVRLQGGSLGKGTFIRKKCDLDMVLCLDGYSLLAEFKRELPEITRKLEDYVRRWQCTEPRFTVGVIQNKKRVVEITINYRTDVEGTARLRVDIVPAFKRIDIKDVQRKYYRMFYLFYA